MYSPAVAAHSGPVQAVNSMMASSPLSDYTVAVMGYMLLIGFLVTTLLLGAFLLVNLGLLSKRNEDRTGESNPSDVGLLKGTIFPKEGTDPEILPAEEELIEIAAIRRQHLYDPKILVREELMPKAA